MHLLPLFALLTVAWMPFSSAEAASLAWRADRFTEQEDPAPDNDHDRESETDMLSRRAARRQARLAERAAQNHDEQAPAKLRQDAVAERLQRRRDRRTRLQLNNDLGDKATLRQDVVQLVNNVRRREDLPPLQYNTLLEQAAQLHAEDMLGSGYFSHQSRSGEDFVDRIQAQSYGELHAAPCDNCTVQVHFGENIAKGQRTARDVVRAWMNSPPHKENILSPKYDEVGIGIAGVYWVQNFGAITTAEN